MGLLIAQQADLPEFSWIALLTLMLFLESKDMYHCHLYHFTEICIMSLSSPLGPIRYSILRVTEILSDNGNNPFASCNYLHKSSTFLDYDWDRKWNRHDTIDRVKHRFSSFNIYSRHKKHCPGYSIWSTKWPLIYFRKLGLFAQTAPIPKRGLLRKRSFAASNAITRTTFFIYFVINSKKIKCTL